VNSVIGLPWAMSHASIPDPLKNRIAPPRDLVRLSVGIEDVEDLIADLEQAFKCASRKKWAANASSGREPEKVAQGICSGDHWPG
jgi:cystathionine beta-lyase